MPPELPEELSRQLLLQGCHSWSCSASKEVSIQLHWVCPRKVGEISELALGITLLAGIRSSTWSMLLKSGADCLTAMCACFPSDVTDGDWCSCTRGARSEADLLGCRPRLGTGDRGLKARLRSTAYMATTLDVQVQLLTGHVPIKRAVPQSTPCRHGLTKHACTQQNRVVALCRWALRDSVRLPLQM